jgi:hypothetical protein
LAFDAAEDPMAQQLQARIRSEGVEAVMRAVCAIAPDEPLGVAVLERYARLHQGGPGETRRSGGRA